jgi:mannose-1-phosphate guanylyltransferase / mannose-6-phosphate isomerase
MFRNYMNNLYAIILCGGSGARLWPLSRPNHPKHLISFNSEYSLLQETYIRINKSINFENIIIVTNKHHYHEVKRQILDVALLAEPIIISEPEGKNTLPAITLAAHHVIGINKDAVLCVFPSDHHIRLVDELIRIVDIGVSMAEKSFFSLVGIKPTYPSTGYGYIKPNLTAFRDINGRNNNDCYLVDKFIEKPSLDSAKRYISENYLWNSGIFIFKASNFFLLMEQNQPRLTTLIQQITPSNIASIYKQLDSVSIDYGLIEKVEEIYVIPADLGWSDLGNWNSIYNFLDKDKNLNSIYGKVVASNSSSSLLWSEKKLLTTYGISNLIVVNTNDATLICDRNNAESVKNLVTEVVNIYPQQVKTSMKVFRPWGTYEVLEEGKSFKVKKIEVNPGCKLSLQFHKHRSEHWVVIEGCAKVFNGGSVFSLAVNESTFISAGVEHRLENPLEEKLIIIEVQSGNYLGEDDIVRINDDYGREEK